MEKNPNSRKLIKCKICGQEKPHHAKGMCFNCYRKHAWERKKVICKNCGRLRYHKAFGLCSTCHIKLHHYDKVKTYNYRKWHNISLNLYRKITKKCLICGFDKIVELHHLDGNHENTAEDNMIGICPNHHKMLHDMRYSEEIKKLLDEKLSSKN